MLSIKFSLKLRLSESNSQWFCNLLKIHLPTKSTEITMILAFVFIIKDFARFTKILQKKKFNKFFVLPSKQQKRSLSLRGRSPTVLCSLYLSKWSLTVQTLPLNTLLKATIQAYQGFDLFFGGFMIWLGIVTLYTSKWKITAAKLK